MNFHQYRTNYDFAHQIDRRVTVYNWVELALECVTKQIADQHERSNVTSEILTESVWIDHRRPFYQIYPFITDSLLKLNLDMPADDAWKVVCNLPRCLLITFPVGFEPAGIRTILACRWITDPVSKSYTNGFCLLWDVGETGQKGHRLLHTLRFLCNGLSTIEKIIETQANNSLTDAELEIGRRVIKIVLGLAMMCDDPDIVRPIVLNADRDKYIKSGDHKFVDKAVRRGVHGWTVGRDIEFVPHVRRPHFAVRWIGHGENKLPKIRPIRGSIIHREKVLNVPTGYQAVTL